MDSNIQRRKMNKIITIGLILLVFIGCKENDEMEETVIENETYYDCSTFFDTGDYSAFCTINTSEINISKSTIDGGGTVCNYIIPALNPETEIETGVQFTSLETSEQAKRYFENNNTLLDTSAMNNPLRFHEEITIGEHEGYISEGQFANYSKSISVRYKNVFVTTAVVYYKDWYPVTPCNYETSELTKLMTAVIENM